MLSLLLEGEGVIQGRRYASRLPPLDRLWLLRYSCPPNQPVSEENRVVWTLFVPYPDGSEQIMEKFRLNQYFSFQNNRDDTNIEREMDRYVQSKKT